MIKFKKVLIPFTVCVMIFTIANTAMAQRQMERLNRGLIAVSSGGGYFISWRLFGDEPLDTGFNVYKSTTKLNSSPITNATCYQDNSGGSGTYTVRAVINGQEQGASENARVLSTNYLSFSANIPSGYEANDASVGDLDGDGEYEIVLKVYPLNAQDNANSGVTDPTILDAYKLNGTRLWSINLGRNIRSGAHYTQFMVYDLDGDGRAEMACKTADGSRDGQGTVIGDANANYVNANGYILNGPEFLTVFDGQTGRALSTVNYLPARGNVSAWGDDYGNRVDRFLACIAYLDGTRPSLVMCRGYYTRAVLVAWDFRNGSLTHRWTFDSNNGYSSYENQGNHQLSVHDVDNDGRDEIIYGSCCIDDNGNGLWNSRLGHGDALHVGDINPNRSGLEVWGIHEGSGTPGSALLDARTGQILWQTPNADVGRGVSADVTSSHSGMECWGGTDGLRSCTNASAGSSPSTANHVVWWDGDLLREILDGITISKYGGGTLLSASGCSSNNSTKSNPCLQADIWGDWREEVIWKAGSSIRIYTTTTSTTNRLYTLMHDSAYRLAIAWQNVAYNQPPHPGFFLGEGMGTPPQPNMYYAGGTPTEEPTPTATPGPTPTPNQDPIFSGGPYPLNGSDYADLPDGITNGLYDFSIACWVKLNSVDTWSRIYDFGGDTNIFMMLTPASGNTGYPYFCITTSGNPGEQGLDGTGALPAGSWQHVAVTRSGNTGILYINTVEVSRNTGMTIYPADLGDTANNFIGRSQWSHDPYLNGEVDQFVVYNRAISTAEVADIGSIPPDGTPEPTDVTTPDPTPTPDGFLGDVNGDGAVDIVDALLVAQYYVGLDPDNFDPDRADVNCDGSIDIVDALLIAQYYVGLISEFCQ